MNVTLSKSAWHSRYYEWCSGRQPSYNNLCPYFWTIVLFLSLFPFFLIINSIKFLSKLFSKNGMVRRSFMETLPGKKFEEFMHRNEKKFEKVGKISRKIFLWLYLGVFGIGFLVLGIVGLFLKNGFLKGMLYLLAGIGSLTVLVFVIWGIVKLTESETYEMISGMIKAKKNKVCPAIEWKC